MISRLNITLDSLLPVTALMSGKRQRKKKETETTSSTTMSENKRLSDADHAVIKTHYAVVSP